MRIKEFILFVVVSFCSCQSNLKAKFEITNETKILIDSINIKTFDHNANPKWIKLKSGQNQLYWLEMTNLPKVDGDYLLTYRDSILKTVRFGYFSNGFPLEKVTNIIIKKDTVIIDQIYDDY